MMRRRQRRVEAALVDARTDPRRFVSLKCAAAYLDVDERILRKYLDNGLLAYVALGRRRKIEPAELVAFIARQRVTLRAG